LHPLESISLLTLMVNWQLQEVRNQ